MTRKRGTGEGGIWHDTATGYWRASLELGYADGKRLRWRSKARTKARLMEKIEAARAELASTGTVASKARRRTAVQTVGEWCEEWLVDHAKPTARPGTYGRYRTAVRNYITPAIGSIPLTALEPGDVRAMLNAITRDGHAPTSRSVHRTLHTALEAAMVDRALSVNVAALVKISRTDASRDDTLDVDEAMAILAASAKRAATGDPEAVQRHAIDATRLLTALRPQEILGIEDAALDLKANRLTVDWQLQAVPYAHGCPDRKPCGRKYAGNCPQRRLDPAPSMEARPIDGRLCLTRPKTAKARRPLPLPPTLVAAYKAHRKARGLVGRASGLLFVDSLGKPIDEADDLAAWRDLCKAAKIERDVDRYIGRHTTGSLLAELGVDPDVIAAMFGHVSRSVSSGYKHQSDGALREAMERLDARLSGNG